VFWFKKFFIRRAVQKASGLERCAKLPDLEKPVNLLLLIHDLPESEVKACRRAIEGVFNIATLRIVLVAKKKPKSFIKDDAVFSMHPGCLSWNAKVIDMRLVEWLDTPVDLCLDMRENQTLSGDFVLYRQRSHFKVNFANDETAVDLSLKMNTTTDLNTKLTQLNKYLMQLNGRTL
jgi:hypothetical protein